MAADGSDLTLRPATAADLPFAWEVYRAAMKPLTEALLTWHDDRQRQTIADEIASGAASIIVDNGESIGWLLVREGADAMVLGQLYIVPEMRNRGLGTVLVRRLIDEAQGKAKSLTLSVMKNNRAQALYRRLGFVTTGESDFKLDMTWRSVEGG